MIREKEDVNVKTRITASAESIDLCHCTILAGEHVLKRTSYAVGKFSRNPGTIVLLLANTRKGTLVHLRKLSPRISKRSPRRLILDGTLQLHEMLC